jgi:hypothetical protein
LENQQQKIKNVFVLLGILVLLDQRVAHVLKEHIKTILVSWHQSTQVILSYYIFFHATLVLQELIQRLVQLLLA